MKLKTYIYLGEGLPFATLFARIGHRTAKLGFYKPRKLYVSGPYPTHVKHLNGTCHHTHVLPCLRTTFWDHKTACCAADFGSIHESKCGKSEFRGARIRVCPEIEVDPQTLTLPFVALTGPICAPLPHVLHRQHKFRSAFSTSKSTSKP
jgi:hypothetical protein